jgi:hypothetical protein
MQIRVLEAELFHAYGRTDMSEVIIAFCNFVTTPKINIARYFGLSLQISGLRNFCLRLTKINTALHFS